MADVTSTDSQKRALLKQLLRDLRNRASSEPDERIAVIGMAGRYPGAENLDQFWDNLSTGRNSVREVPAERWDWKQFANEKGADGTRGIYTRFGGFLDRVDEFDPLFFAISPVEAQAMDPQERLFLQTAWHALEDAGQTRRKLTQHLGGEVGVFVGVMNSHYEWFNAEARLQGAVTGAHSHFWSLANRLSYFLNLTGPSFAVDSACSASLTAIHLACESLRRGECRAAIAGGVNLILHPLHYHKLCMLEMLSPDGTCKAFGVGANGFVDGEGVGAIVLKPLRAAIADGDRIHGVILGSAVNAGGKTGGYTVPNPQAQKKLVQRALSRANVDPETISYVEAHGTGTSLGDPIEVAALRQVFDPGAPTSGAAKVAIGSVKSNIGHLESAAGVAGLTKVLLQLRHRQLAPSINAAELNPKIEWGPLELQRSLGDWRVRVGAVRRAGVSSFGAGGANAHVIVEEYVAPPRAPAPSGPQVIVLSAKNDDRLRQFAEELAHWLEQHRAGGMTLADVAFTLQTGREPMEARLALAATTLVDAAEKLRAFAANSTHGIHHGRIGTGRAAAMDLIGSDDAGRAFVRSVIVQRDADRLARLWVAGAEIDWSAWHPTEAASPSLVSLPHYPFARDRYWIGGEMKPVTPVLPGTPSMITASAPHRLPEVTCFTPTWEAVTSPVVASSRDTVFVVSTPADEMALRAAWLAQGRASDALLVHVATSANDPTASAWLPKADLRIAVVGAGQAAPAAARVPADVSRVLNLLQRVAAQSRGSATAPEWVYVAHADAPQLGAVRGLLRTAVAELSGVRIGTVGVASRDEGEFWRTVIVEALRPLEGSVVDLQVDAATRRVRQWRRPAVAASGRVPVWRRGGVYLITGGLGGLGRICARHLARAHGARLVLVGRSPGTAATVQFIAELQELGGEAAYIQADVADRAACERAWAETKARFGGIHGILHAAGVTRDRALEDKTAADVEAVFAGKTAGWLNLDAVSRNEPLETVVLFSSVSGVLGNFGQADYAAANGFLGSLAAERNQRQSRGECHGHTIAIHWPLWANGGMTLNGAHAARAKQQFGLVPLAEESGIAVLDALVASSADEVLVWSGDATWIANALNPTASAVVVTPALNTSDQTRTTEALGSVTLGLGARAEAFLRELIAGPIKLAPEQIEVDRRLEEYGIDSVLIRAFNARLEQVLPGVPASVLFEYPTVRALAAYLVSTRAQDLDKLLVSQAEPQTTKRQSETSATSVSRESLQVSLPSAAFSPPSATIVDDPVAIVGLSGRYPGARNVNEFWANLAAGRDLIREVPPERWDASRFLEPDPAKSSEGKAYCQRGGFIEDADKFDPLFFGISPLEAKAMDPQERIFLELAWEALEDAGYTRPSIDRNVGVFVGVTTLSYALHGAEAFAAGKLIVPSSVPWSLANRVSFIFDLTGPSVPVDTACSASLTAIHFACDSLRRGECRAAIVGGINLYLHPLKYHVMCQTRMLSRSGFCHSFGEGGDGFIPGEGGGAIVLKPLSRARADGDHIYGVVRGTAINHGGRTNGYTVPNPRAQAEVIRAALASARIDPRTISYIEAHGTGTVLGDPIEVEGLTQAFRTSTAEKQFCALGSVKSAIGHLESAAGIAGVTKVLLQMQHGRFAPTLHAETPNRSIHFADTPFYLQREQAEWRRPEIVIDGVRQAVPRRAGISSFGAGGANAHVILEEYVDARVMERETGKTPQLLVLSARSKERLHEYANRLRDYLQAMASDTTGRLGRFADLAFTLQTGREAFAARLAVVAMTPAEVVAKLSYWLTSAAASNGAIANQRGAESPPYQNADGVFVGRAAAAGSATVARAGNLEEMAAAWVGGAAVDWTALSQAREVRRVSAPTYPFARERYWFDDTEHGAESRRDRAVEASVRPALTPPSVRAAASAETPWYGAMPGERDFGPAGDAVSLEIVDGVIAVVAMRDRANRNMFTEQLLRGLLATFSDIQRRPEIKAVIVTGSDNVFSMGGTRDGLLGLAEKKAQFTDIPFLFRGFLECPIPVIAAVQGHASGGGLLFGLYADFAVLAAEGVYTSNFLKYGFTPGMGATLILPEKLGTQLATEMMFTAASFTGEELQRRGALVRVKPANEVLAEALMIARSLAEKPGAAVRELKRELAGRILEKMPAVLASELAMHERTFGAPEVRARIEATFAQVAGANDTADVQSAIRQPETGATLESVGHSTFADAVQQMRAERKEPVAPVAAAAAVSVADESAVADVIFGLLHRLLHLRRESVDVDASFNQLGLDSISGVEFIRDLNKRFALNLEAVALYDHGSVARLTAFVAQQVAARALTVSRSGGSSISEVVWAVPGTPSPRRDVALTSADHGARHLEPAVAPRTLAPISRVVPQAQPAGGKIALKRVTTAPAVQAAPAHAPAANAPTVTAAALDTRDWPDDAIAVVGIACRYPGAADKDAFWRNLVGGVDSTGEVPAGRWSGGPTEKHLRSGGFLSDIDQFDPEFFKLLPIEAEYMEPQQRLFLEESWKALEDAGFAPRALAGRKCGVFVGASTGDYYNDLDWAGRESGIAHAFTGGSPSILAARISYHLDLTGPSIALDTACSSSLVAVHQACRSILAGDSDLALAGGVSLMLTPQTHMMTGKAGMLSPTGECRPFDHKANGIVISEGVGLVVLQRLSQARAEHRQIYAVIRGTAVNQDGRTNGITAPSARSQAALLAEAHTRAGVKSDDITYIEAHGTGTSLGDPVEVRALRTVFGETAAAPRCALGSVKSNIGHAMLAAGVAGLIKTVLALRHRTIPPTVHFEAENEHLRLNGSPLYVPTKSQTWTPSPSGRRIAGVSAFGFSGTNAHVVVEEWPQPLATVNASAHWPVLVSARDAAGLRARLRDLRFWLDEAGAGAGLADLAYTLANGRNHFGVRWGCVVKSMAELADRIDEALPEESLKRSDPSVVGDATRPFTVESIAAGNSREIAEQVIAAYVGGADVSVAMAQAPGRIISLPTYPFARRRFWIDRVPGSVAPVSVPVSASPAESRRAERPPEPLVERSEPERSVVALEYVKALVAAETKLDASRLDVTADFESCGLNSIIISALNSRLERDFGPLPSTLFFTYKSIAAIAEYLAREHGQKLAELAADRTGRNSALAEPTPAGRLHADAAKDIAASSAAIGSAGAPTDAIAIIGMSGRFPMARDLDEFWDNLKAGRDCVTEIPADRWDYRRFWTEGAGKRDGIYCKWGGFIDDADKFDASFFNIAPREARFMDPQERVFLETVWGCLEDAGYTRARLQDTAAADRRAPVGVFVGVSLTDYQLHGGEAWGRGEVMPVNSQIYALANRVSYFLNLGGPSLPIDTACSSSLYALHLACESIRSGESRMALAGGVNLSLHPNKYLTLCLGQFAASDGRCHAFGEGGDGYVPAEGVGVVLLKPLSAALRDGDQIHAVIRGTAVNHDGKTHGFTVPNPVAQTEVIRRALDKARISADAVSCIEAHGTGTALGDPIEITGLSDAFAADTKRRQFCAIGSVKSNIGHAEAAAGIAQLFKVVLQMKHRTLVPNLLHSERPNSRINFAQTPFRIQTACAPWQPEAGRRIAGVSSFGVGGVNVHVVVEEPPVIDPPRSRTTTGPFVLTLSAKTEGSLRESAKRLRVWLEKQVKVSAAENGGPDLGAVAYTLQTGRDAMPVRSAVVVSTVAETLARLGDIELATGDMALASAPAGTPFGVDPEDRAYLQQLAADGKWEKLARRWAEGAVFDWESLYAQESRPRRISLPTYAFERERYWQFDPAPAVALITTPPPIAIAPATVVAGSWREQLAAATPTERQQLLMSRVQCIVGELLAFSPPNTAPLDKGLFELGMESVQNAQLVAKLAGETGLELYPTVTFDYPNVRALATYLAHQFADAPVTAAASTSLAPQPTTAPVETFFVEEVWEPANLSAPVADPRMTDAPVLLLARDDDARSAVEEALRARGDRGRVILLKPGYARQTERDDVLTIDARASADYTSVVDQLGGATAVRVLHGWSDRPFSTHGDVLAAQLERGPYAMFHLVQALMRRATKGVVRLIAVTVGGDQNTAPHAAALRALLRSVTQENPAFDCRLLECSHDSAGLARTDWAVAVDELLRQPETGVDVRHEPGRRLVRGLRERLLDPIEETNWPERPVILITGGLGGLGLSFAEHLARTRAARLALSGRSAVAASDPRLRRLEELGAEVLYVRADVSRRADVEALVVAARTKFGRIDGVVHAAGVLRDAFVPTKKVSDWHEVLAPKVFGTVHLDEATRDDALYAFVVLSSLTAAVGNAGQTDYAYANCFEQEFMRWRAREAAEGRRAGRSIAVNWPLWAEGGMKVDPAMETFLRDVIGLKLLPKAVGLSVFDRALAGAGELFTVLHGVRERIAQHLKLKLRPSVAAPSTPIATALTPQTEPELEAALEAELRAVARLSTRPGAAQTPPATSP